MGWAVPTRAEPVEISRDGTRRPKAREWVPEAPVALEFNGLSYAVMMATPADLEDFARGFALTEGLAKTPADVTDLAVAETDLGWIVRSTLAGLGVEKLTERVRSRVAESSCGLCGIENLEAVARPLPKVPAHRALDPQAIFTGLAALRDHQPLTRRTGAAHAAAFCDEARARTSAATTRSTSSSAPLPPPARIPPRASSSRPRAAPTRSSRRPSAPAPHASSLSRCRPAWRSSGRRQPG